MSIINEWQPNLAPISGNAVTMLGAADPPNLKQTSSTVEDMPSPGEFRRAPAMGGMAVPCHTQGRMPHHLLSQGHPYRVLG